MGAGGANVWVRDGQYTAATLVINAGVHLYGGFDAAFDLAGRDVSLVGTVINGVASQRAFDVVGSSPTVIVDGLRLDGGSVATFGLSVDETEIELRSVQVDSFANHGIRLINNTLLDEIDVQISNCAFTRNGADGLSLNGGFDLRVDGSSFDTNAQEGMDLDDLVALEGQKATLQVIGCRFFGNGAEGLDADLSAPLGGGAGGGSFEIEIRGCSFERNGFAGLLIDEEYENVPGWSADIVVRECQFRANRTAGVHIDADGLGSILLERVLANGNRGDGIWISSETDAGVVVISASVASGNLGAGMRATFGNRSIVASHCILAGNLGGGLISEVVESTATSCISYLQSNPWQGTRLSSTVDVTDPLAGAFQVAPEEYAYIVAQAQATLTLDVPVSFAPGVPVELSDDGTELVAMQVMDVGTTVVLDAAPDDFAVPGLLSSFAPAAGVDEDYTLPLGSPAEGQGLTPPGGADRRRRRMGLAERRPARIW